MRDVGDRAFYGAHRIAQDRTLAKPLITNPAAGVKSQTNGRYAHKQYGQNCSATQPER